MFYITLSNLVLLLSQDPDTLHRLFLLLLRLKIYILDYRPTFEFIYFHSLFPLFHV